MTAESDLLSAVFGVIELLSLMNTYAAVKPDDVTAVVISVAWSLPLTDTCEADESKGVVITAVTGVTE